ncbi:MAG TPA: AMP-binding protein, partial [Chthoniobacteraceae bacterium]|nr:AMP-binding protein [Chthoniobacteraceae bacterium]
MDIVAEIDAWGRETPERIAHQSGGRSLSYGELLARSDSLAAWLKREWDGDSSPVAVRGHKEPEMLIAFLGAVK